MGRPHQLVCYYEAIADMDKDSLVNLKPTLITHYRTQGSVVPCSMEGVSSYVEFSTQFQTKIKKNIDLWEDLVCPSC